MSSDAKKQLKADVKLAKKEAKARVKATRPADGGVDAGAGAAPRSSLAVRYAELVRGGLYLLLGVSLIVALLLGERGAIVSLDDLIDSLFAQVSGKIVLALIGLALFVYGLKHLRLVR